jgi:hypothetical protein
LNFDKTNLYRPGFLLCLNNHPINVESVPEAGIEIEISNEESTVDESSTSQSSTENVQHITNTLTRKRKTKNPVWESFLETGNGKEVKCIGCAQAFRFPQRDRLQAHIEKCLKRIKMSEVELTVPRIDSSVVPVRSTHIVGEKDHSRFENWGELPPQKNPTQRSLESFREATSEYKKKLVDKKLMHLISGANLPFNIVENPAFIEFVRELRHSYTLPSAKIVGGSLVDASYSEAKLSVKARIQGSKAVIMQDGWTSPQSEAVIAHSLSVNEKIVFLDGVTAGEEKKTADVCLEKISDAMSMATEDFDVKVIGVITDNASVMNSMRNKLQQINPGLFVYGCNSHLMNLIGKDLTPKETKEKVVAVQKFFKNHDVPAAMLKNLNGNRPKLPTDTRWNSQLSCLESFMENQGSYLRILRTGKVKIPNDIQHTIEDGVIFQEMNEAINLLQPIARSLDKVSQFQLNYSSGAYKICLSLNFCTALSYTVTTRQLNGSGRCFRMA